MVSELPFSDVRIAQELAWYATYPRHLFTLFDAYIYWSKEIVKVSHVGVSDMFGKMKNFYTRRGFKKQEDLWLLPL